MKIKFVQRPGGGRDFKVGDEADFNGRIEEGYARKYIDRGWAEEVVEKPVEDKPKAEEARKPFIHRK